MIKKILNKVFGIQFGSVKWVGDLPEPPSLTYSPTITGTDSYSYGSENVVKILPKRDSKGRFCK